MTASTTIKQENLKMATRKVTAAEAAKDWIKRDNGSNRAEMDNKMNNQKYDENSISVLKIKLWNLKVSNRNMYANNYLLDDISDSTLPIIDRKKLYEFVKYKFKRGAMGESKIKRENFSSEKDYLEREIEEETSFCSREMESLIKQVLANYTPSQATLDFLYNGLNDLKKNEDKILEFYAYGKCPVCGTIGHIHENVKNHGGYIGGYYFCNCPKVSK